MYTITEYLIGAAIVIFSFVVYVWFYNWVAYSKPPWRRW